MTRAGPGTGLSYDELMLRLDVAEQTLGAITRGEVDGLMVTVDGVPRVFTLDGSDTFYRVLVEQMPEGAAAVSASGTVLYANPGLAELLGVPVEQLPGAQLQPQVAPEHRAGLSALLHRADPGPATELVLHRRDGSSVPVSVSVRRLGGHDDDVRCVVVVDLTAQRRGEEHLRVAEARFRSAFDGAPIGMALLGLDGVVDEVNEALCQLARCRAAELVDHPLPWLDPDATQKALAQLVVGDSDRLVVPGRRVTGRDTVRVNVHLRLLPGDGVRRLVIAQVQDDSERHRHEKQLRHVADHDQLTGLLNRRGFDGLLDAQLRSADSGEALLLLDIDHFKYINDTRGHHIGDEVLVQLAAVLRAQVREGDVVARLGGDEFAVLLPQGDAAGTAERLVQAARRVVVDALDGRRLSVSVGVVQLRDLDLSAGEVMALADLAMYDSKEAGRDRFTLSRGPSESMHGTRMSWLSRIEQALSRGELALFAQPIVDLVTGRAAQSELLVRLPSEQGPVAAEQWFPTAERCGLAPQIDEWVLGRALALLADDRFPAVSVNISATTLLRQDWQDLVVAGLRRSRVDASRITFEITETAAIGNVTAAIRFTEVLRGLGCRLALDDFGAGFASFHYLKHLPFDDVKIDGEFVRGCVDDPRDRAIIRAMVEVAGTMGRRTVAECVEDDATLELVRSMGVDLAQGYAVGRPAPI